MKAMTKSKQQGFALIELMILTAIIRVLVAVAPPAYDLYRNRARFSESILSIGNIVYSTATQKIKVGATTGQQLNVAIKNAILFPVMITQTVGIGEGSSALDSMLDKCAIYCEAEVDNAVDGLTALMKPIIMAVLGILVGGLMIAMYLPIFQLGAVM